MAQAEHVPITIPIDFPTRDEPAALAQLVKRCTYSDVAAKAATTVTYSGRSEADVMWSAVCLLQRQLAEAGFAPR